MFRANLYSRLSRLLVASVEVSVQRASSGFRSILPTRSLVDNFVPNSRSFSLVSGSQASSSFNSLDLQSEVPASKIRNVAIIAHVDHGKTTLVDKMLTQAGGHVPGERVMDSHALERERGITISSKYTSLQYGAYTINIVDTPGHADFGGEVERVLGMVDGAVLLVDANEGALSQTKFVLEKALRAGLSPIVVLNKVDRPGCTKERCTAVESDIFDLFASLGASDAQLDFRVLYSSARQGWAAEELPPTGEAPAAASLAPLMDSILAGVPPPPGGAPFAMLVSMLGRDPFLGRIAIGRVHAGTARVGDRLRILRHTGEREGPEAKLTKILKRVGTSDVELREASAGDIVMVAGAEHVGVADTLADPAVAENLPPGHIDPPTLSMVFSPNDSPLAGTEGNELTANKIGERLRAEAESSVSMRVSTVQESGGERFEVKARGELQLGLLIENMRREGFEFSVSPPQVVLREEGGSVLEPIEDVVIECPDVCTGTIIDSLTARKGELQEMVPVPELEGRMRLTFSAPSRGLLGFRSVFATVTRGSGVMNRAFSKYDVHRGSMDSVSKGALVSMADGKTVAFSLWNLEPRGVLFVSPGQKVYSGMIIGEHAKGGDLEVNPIKEKAKTNFRAMGTDENIRLTPPRAMTLEDAIGYVGPGELIEVTPKSVRLRKSVLDSNLRKRASRSSAR
uniref:GTP-binding protein n=1 Tax=Tetraselmis sp. GSL018 TaxID=582737 RepID=A0A061RB01_9CHLO